jgi:hypothetical protein
MNWILKHKYKTPLQYCRANFIEIKSNKPLKLLAKIVTYHEINNITTSEEEVIPILYSPSKGWLYYCNEEPISIDMEQHITKYMFFPK